MPLTVKPRRRRSGPYVLHLSVQDGRLVFDIRRDNDTPLADHRPGARPFRRLMKDYQLLVDSHIKAVEEGREARIQAIDMGRRGLHNEGADADARTARRQDRHRLRHRAPAVHAGLRAAPEGLSSDADRRRPLSHRLGGSATTAGRCASSTRRSCPGRWRSLRLTDVAQAAHAIRSMQVRGAPLIGAVAAYGLCLALRAGSVHRRRWSATRRCWPRRGRPRSTCAGRWSGC